MKSYVLACSLALLAASPVFAQERTAGQAYDAQVNWGTLSSQINLVSTQNQALAATIDKLMACNRKQKIYAPGDPAADADGCIDAGSNIQTGMIYDTTAYGNRTKTVVFKKPFKNMPKVGIAMQGYYFDGPCRGDTVSFSPVATSITKTGFQVVMGGANKGCKKARDTGLLWIATDEMSEQTAVPPPPSGGGTQTTPTGTCSGGGDQDCTYHPFAGQDTGSSMPGGR